jgi:DNA-binding FrmR family transcriptional regulator
MKKGACHHDKLTSLRRIEGQVRGVQKMIEEGRYCVDILNALGAVIGALRKVESNILKDHLNACAKTAFEGKSNREKEEKLQELYGLLNSFRR